MEQEIHNDDQTTEATKQDDVDDECPVGGYHLWRSRDPIDGHEQYICRKCGTTCPF